MKAAALLALLLIVPLAGATEAQRTHVHDRYEVVITADVVLGFGVDIQQLGWICDVTYDPVLPDSDEDDATDTVAAYVGVTCSGPGTVLFSSGTPATVDPFTNQAADACVIVEDFETSGASSTTRYVIAGYFLTFDENSPDQEKCSAQLIISNNDTGEEWAVLVPIVIFNDDSQASAFLTVFNLAALELAVLIFAALAALALTLFIEQRQVRVGAALVLLVVGVVFFIFQTPIDMILGSLFGVLGAVSLLMEAKRTADEQRSKRGPRRFFE